ncbi:MAG: hypothetical protein HY658_05680, partial [Actinobacteria bacterium]|nr:hypothetical protein [Actinomycetota bacterium]
VRIVYTTPFETPVRIIADGKVDELVLGTHRIEIAEGSDRGVKADRTGEEVTVECVAPPKPEEPGWTFTDLSRFQVQSPFAYQRISIEDCNAVGSYTRPHVFTIDVSLIRADQVGHGGETDAFIGRIDPVTGAFVMVSNRNAPYLGLYAGGISPEGMGGGLYVFSSPDCGHVVYTFTLDLATGEISGVGPARSSERFSRFADDYGWVAELGGILEGALDRDPDNPIRSAEDAERILLGDPPD